ncbi:hypothetical protein K32_14420 [Kaistia sp. 32K]|uniref:hypothetical protein n=1 Tax=Kaistia sp. 32K TaxID=2795690 RepID=UPI001914EFBA|nr:hypothetical protein [Kaistia sp. 32K]BCP52825.1 hypothetical protein K32_14420 [Kaistia sp. 32K]
MNARALTGAALAAALKKAVPPAISEALQRNAGRLRAALDEMPTDLSPLPRGEVGPQGRVRGSGLIGEGATPRPPATPSTSPSGRGESGAPSFSVGSAGSGLSVDVTLIGENLFAREFGALDAAADPVIGPAISSLKRRSR